MTQINRLIAQIPNNPERNNFGFFSGPIQLALNFLYVLEYLTNILYIFHKNDKNKKKLILLSIEWLYKKLKFT
jgi:hypothetical protein